MQRRFVLHAMAVVAGIAGIAAWRWSGRGAGAIPAGTVLAPSDLTASAAASADLRPERGDSQPSRELVFPVTEPWSLCGRVMDRQGLPIEGAAVIGTIDDAEKAELVALTGGDGRFTVDRKQRPECCFRLEVDAGGFAREWWDFDTAQIEQRSTSKHETTVGNLTLTRCGAIAGRLFDSEGKSIARSFGIICRSDRAGGPLGPESSASSFGRIECATDALTGEFRLERLPEGLRTIFLRWPNVDDAREDRIRALIVRPGETRFVPVPLLLSNRPDQIFVKFDLPQGFTGISHEHFGLTGSDGAVRRTAVHVGSYWVFSGLADDDYTLSVDDPLLLPERRTLLRPNDRPVLVALRGGAAVNVEVVDAQSGAAVPSFSLTGECTDAIGTRWTHSSESMDSKISEIALKEVPSGDLRISADADGYGCSAEIVKGLVRGESRSVTLRLERKQRRMLARVKGVILNPDGVTRAKGVLVNLVCREYTANDSSHVDTVINRSTMQCVVSESGAFDLEVPLPGTYVIKAQSTDYPLTISREFEVADSSSVVYQDLTLAEGRVVRGLLTVPSGFVASGNVLEIAGDHSLDTSESAEKQSSAWRFSISNTTTGSGGAFEVKGLANGTYAFFLRKTRRDRDPLPTELTSGSVPLGTVEVKGSSIDNLRLSLHPESLMDLRILVRAGGTPLPFVLVHVSSMNGDRHNWLTCDADGSAFWGPLPSGPIDVFVHDLESGWRFRGEQSFSCTGPEATVNVEIPLTTCTLTLVDEKNAPLAGRFVNVLGEFGPGDPTAIDHTCRSDAAGEITLSVPAVKGRIRTYLDTGQAELEFDALPPARAILVVR